MENKKRAKTICGSVFNIFACLINSVYSFYMGYIAFIVLSLALDLGTKGDPSTTTAIVSGGYLVFSYAARMLLSGACFILTILVLAINNKPNKEFVAKKKRLIAVIVINCIIVVLGLISYIIGAAIENPLLIGLDIFVYVLFMLAVLFYILDIRKAKKAVATAVVQDVEVKEVEKVEQSEQTENK